MARYDARRVAKPFGFAVRILTRGRVGRGCAQEADQLRDSDQLLDEDFRNDSRLWDLRLRSLTTDDAFGQHVNDERRRRRIPARGSRFLLAAGVVRVCVPYERASTRRARRVRESYFANNWPGSKNDLNSRALPAGSRKNMVACSPVLPLKRMYGSIANAMPAALIRSAKT